MLSIFIGWVCTLAFVCVLHSCVALGGVLGVSIYIASIDHLDTYISIISEWHIFRWTQLGIICHGALARLYSALSLLRAAHTVLTNFASQFL